MVESEGRACVNADRIRLNQDRERDGDRNADDAGGNASMQEISRAAKEKKKLQKGLSCSNLHRPWMQDDKVEGRKRDGQSGGLRRETGEGVTKGKMQEEGGRAG